jgi:hypothetical protein
MKKAIFLTVLCLFLFVSTAEAEVYDLMRVFYDSGRRLRLNIPDGIDTVRGILIYGNGGGDDSSSKATDPEFVAFAESYDFAVLGTGGWSNFSMPNDSELLFFEDMLAEFAEVTGHPELIDAPWLPMGFSNGGQMSYGFNAKRPWKVIAFITAKGAYYNTIAPRTESLLTPGMLVAGEIDSQMSRDNIRKIYEINRLRGALWAWVEEQNKAHDEGDSRQLVLTFFAECLRLRYPADETPANGPVTLKNLHEFDGWLVDQSSWRDDIVRIYSYDDAPGDKRDYGWVPSEKIACYYQAFSSYRKASIGAWGSAGVVDAPAKLVYNLQLTASGQRGDSLTSTQFYLDGLPVGFSEPLNNMEPSISIEENTGGFHAFTAIVSYTSGVRHATHLKRVFVRGPHPLSAFEWWAVENLPEGLQGPDDMLFDDGVTNIERFAFGLGVSGPVYDFNPLQPAEPLTQIIDGMVYTVYTYHVSEEARISGLNIMPQISSDGLNWFDIVNIDDPARGPRQYVSRSGNTVTFKCRTSGQSYLFRIKISDTLEGVDYQ